MTAVDLWSKVGGASGMPSFSIGHSIFLSCALAFESMLSSPAPCLKKRNTKLIWHFARL